MEKEVSAKVAVDSLDRCQNAATDHSNSSRRDGMHPSSRQRQGIVTHVEDPLKSDRIEELRHVVTKHVRELELDNQRLKAEKKTLQRQLVRLRRRVPPPSPARIDTVHLIPKSVESFDEKDLQRHSIQDGGMRLSMAESNGFSSHEYSSLSDSYEDYALRYNLVETVRISFDDSESSYCEETKYLAEDHTNVILDHSPDDPEIIYQTKFGSIEPNNSLPIVSPPKVTIARKHFVPSSVRLSFPASSVSNSSETYVIRHQASQSKVGDACENSFLGTQTPVEISSSLEQTLLSSDTAVRYNRQRQYSINSFDRRRGLPYLQTSFDNHSAPNTPQAREKVFDVNIPSRAFDDNENINRIPDAISSSLNLLNSYLPIQEHCYLLRPPTTEGAVIACGLATRLAGLAYSLSVYTCVKGKARLVQTRAAIDGRTDGGDSEDNSSESDFPNQTVVSTTPCPPSAVASVPNKNGQSSGGIVKSAATTIDPMTESSTSMEYYSPPDDISISSATQSADIADNKLLSSVSVPDKRVFRNGLLSKLSGKFKLWHQYWCILTNRGVFFYSAKPKESEQPSRYIALSEIETVRRSCSPGQNILQQSTTFEVKTSYKCYTFCGESAWDTDLWIRGIRKALRRAHAELVVQRNSSQLLHKGWLKRVKCGYARKVWCLLLGNYLVYFRSQSELSPTGFRNLCLSHLRPIGRTMKENNCLTSDSDSDTTDTPLSTRTLSLWEKDKDPVYFICHSEMDHDKWKHYLSLVCVRPSVGAHSLLSSIVSTTFQSVMYHTKEPISEPISRTTDPNLTPLCINLFNCLLKISYPTGKSDKEIMYEKVKFIQDICKVCFANPGMKDELFLQIVKQSRPTVKETRNKRSKVSLLCSSTVRHMDSIGSLGKRFSASDTQPYLAIWECMCLVLPLFLASPQVLEGLEAYLKEFSVDTNGEMGKYAAYCLDILAKVKEQGGRQDVPSFLEVTAVSLRNPYTHEQPFSLPIHLMTGSYHVVSFDSTTSVGDLSNVVSKIIFSTEEIDDTPNDHGCSFSMYCKSDQGHFVFLEEKWKICDVITRFERSLVEKDPCVSLEEITIKLFYRIRGFSSKLFQLGRSTSSALNPIECEVLRLCVHQLHHEVKEGYYLLQGSELLMQVALLCQAEYKEYRDLRQKDTTLGRLVSRFFPASLTNEEDKVMHLKLLLLEKWSSLASVETTSFFLEYLKRLERLCSDQFCAHAFLCRNLEQPGQNRIIQCSRGGKQDINWLILVCRYDRIVLLSASSCEPLKRIPIRNIVSFGGQGRSFFLVFKDPRERGFVKLHFLLPDICSILELITTLSDYVNNK